MRKEISLILILVFLLPVLVFAQEIQSTKVEGSKIDKLRVDTSSKCFLTGYEYSILLASQGNVLLPSLEVVPTNQEDAYLNLIPSLTSSSVTITFVQGPPRGVNITINNQYGSHNNAAVSQR
ncbi:MAG: hypothetical protein QW404_03150 [Candidatus Nanoarchaeia archaeon]